MNVEAGEKLLVGRPAPPGGGIHDLNKRPESPPDHHKVGDTVRQSDHNDCRQSPCFSRQQVIGRQHDLLRVQPELHSDFLDCVNRGAVNVGLAGLTQPSIAHGNAEALEHTLQRGRTTVHGGCLHNFRNDQTGMPVRNLHGSPPLAGTNRK